MVKFDFHGINYFLYFEFLKCQLNNIKKIYKDYSITHEKS
jgi:hypothetical protein